MNDWVSENCKMNRKQTEQFLAECSAKQKIIDDNNAANGLIELGYNKDPIKISDGVKIRNLHVKFAMKKFDGAQRRLIDQKLINDTKQYAPFLMMSRLLATQCADEDITPVQHDRICALFTVAMLGTQRVTNGTPEGNNKLWYQIDFYPYYDFDLGRGFEVLINDGEMQVLRRAFYIPYTYYENGLMDAYSDFEGGELKRKFNRPFILVQNGVPYNG